MSAKKLVLSPPPQLPVSVSPLNFIFTLPETLLAAILPVIPVFKSTNCLHYQLCWADSCYIQIHFHWLNSILFVEYILQINNRNIIIRCINKVYICNSFHRVRIKNGALFSQSAPSFFKYHPITIKYFHYSIIIYTPGLTIIVN